MQNTGGGMPAAPSPAAPTPPSVYGQQHGQQQLLVPPQQQYQQRQPQHHPQQLQQLPSNSPASTAATGTATTNKILINGGRFDFDDGGTYCGGWEDGKAHGHGVCTGPKGQGAYSGSWHYGFEVSGVYMWPSGNTFEGQWQNGKRHGLGVESRGRWLYRGEWTQGFKGRYGVRQSATTNAKYEGTWANGLQDGYGSETYADGGTFQGQWMRGMRHGYGVRTSARFGMASHSKPGKSDGIRNSLSSLGSEDLHHNKAGSGSDDQVIVSEGRDKKLDDTRGGFVLKANSDEQPSRRKTLVSKSTQGLKRTFMSGFRMRKQRSTGELEKKTTGSIRSTASCTSWISTGSSQSAMGESYNTDSNASFIVEDEHMDVNTTETYVGEWKNDKRSGFGVAERTDGLKYEGEWFGNKKYGYGVTTFKDGTKEEGKYKNNVLITSQKKRHLFLIRSAKLKERVDAAVNAAHRASKIALQKADIAISRMATARGKAELSDIASDHAREDHDIAKETAKQFAPDFVQPGLEKGRLRDGTKLKSSIKQTPAQKPVPAAPDPVPLPKTTVSHVGGSVQSQYDSKDPAETTSQFVPRSIYANPYYQSSASDNKAQQQYQPLQQQTPASGVQIGKQQANSSNVRSSFSRDSLTTADPQKKTPASKSVEFHRLNNGYIKLSDDLRLQPPPLPPNRVINKSPSNSDQYASANSSSPLNSNVAQRAGAQSESGAQSYNRSRQYSVNGTGTGSGDGGGSNVQQTSGRQSRQADRLSRESPSTSHAAYSRNEEDYNQDRNGACSVQFRDQDRDRNDSGSVHFRDQDRDRNGSGSVHFRDQDRDRNGSGSVHFRDQDRDRNGSGSVQFRDQGRDRNGGSVKYRGEPDRDRNGGSTNYYDHDRDRNGGKQYRDLQRRESVHRGSGERRDSQRRDSNTDFSRFRDRDIDETDQSRLRRNAKYVNRDSTQSEHQQQYASIDHHEHYNRPPSRDNSVDRYQRRNERLRSSSRQSSVEKSSSHHQQQPDGRSPFGSGASGQSSRANQAPGTVSYTVPKTSRQSPFEDVIINQRNIGQEILPSPSGCPKRTESLYVNPDAARRDHKPKVSIWKSCEDDFCSECILQSPTSTSGEECCPETCIYAVPPRPVRRKPRLLPSVPPLKTKMANLKVASEAINKKSPRQPK